jgi:hypothetical protein
MVQFCKLPVGSKAGYQPKSRALRRRVLGAARALSAPNRSDTFTHSRTGGSQF